MVPLLSNLRGILCTESGVEGRSLRVGMGWCQQEEHHFCTALRPVNFCQTFDGANKCLLEGQKACKLEGRQLAGNVAVETNRSNTEEANNNASKKASTVKHICTKHLLWVKSWDELG